MSHDPFTVVIDDCTDNDVHQPYTAFNQGYDAFMSGASRELCPYTDETFNFSPLKAWWLDGFGKALEDHPQ